MIIEGVFMDSAQDLIAQPLPTEEDLARRFQRTVADALAAGLVSLHDAGFKPESLAFFKRYVLCRRPAYVVLI